MDVIKLLQQAKKNFQPPPDLTTSEWAEERRYLSAESSAEPGRWRNNRTPYLVGIMNAVSEKGVHELCIMSSAQVGKALWVNTKIPTPEGWKTMGELSVGDRVFDDRGNPTKVVFATDVMYDRQCWKLTFSDGSSIVADSEHKWTVDYTPWGESKGSQTITTEEIADVHFYEKSRMRQLRCPRSRSAALARSRKRNPFAISLAKPLKLPAKKLPIDPYLLGVWLGDGVSRTGYLSLNKDDSGEILSYVKEAGYLYKIKPDSKNVFRVHTDPKPQPISLYKKLKELRLISYCGKSNLKKVDKFVPSQYLRGSIEQRLSLLQGLMDTDGYIDSQKGRSEFTTVSPDLAVDFSELLSSLGIKHTVKEKETFYTKEGKRVKCRNVYRFSFLVYDDLPIYRLSRKLNRMIARDSSKRVSETTRVRITSVEKVESVPVKCIQVDSNSHLYLAGERMIPTHNTELISNVLGRAIDIDPCPILCLQPTLEMAQAYSKDRFAPMVRDSPALRDKLTNSSRDKNSTILHKNFPGGQLTFAGANSPASLASRPVRMVLCDEIDRYPLSAGSEGDPVNLARKRTTTFWNWSLILVSTPTVSETSRIEKAWLQSDQRRYFVKCPHCTHKQHLSWDRIEYPGKGTDSAEPEAGVYYICESCRTPIAESEKLTMVRSGEWIATAKSDNNSVGFHLNELYSLWRKWKDVALDYEIARTDPNLYRVWVNTSLGLPFENTVGEKLDWEHLYDRSKMSGYCSSEIPDGVLMLTAGVDVQADRLEAVILGWGRGEQCWVIRYEKIMGDPLKDDVWQQLASVTGKSYYTSKDVAIKVRATCIDTGYLTQDVYRQIKKHRYLHWFAIKGRAGDRPLVSKPSKQKLNYKGKAVKGSIDLYLVGVDTAKETVYARTQIDKPGDKYLNFANDLDKKWFAGLCSEVQVTKHKDGRPYRIWEAIPGVRNEPLDCTVYGYAAADLAGLTRMNWGKLEAKYVEDKNDD